MKKIVIHLETIVTREIEMFVHNDVEDLHKRATDFLVNEYDWDTDDEVDERSTIFSIEEK